MLTAMIAVDNTIAGKTDKASLWEINTETSYHEEKAGFKVNPPPPEKKVKTLKGVLVEP